MIIIIIIIWMTCKKSGLLLKAPIQKNTSGHLFFYKILCSSNYIFVELHLDDVLVVLLVVGFENLIYKTCR